MRQCPNCGRYTMFNRNVVGDQLWYCPDCEERWSRAELDEMGYEWEEDYHE